MTHQISRFAAFHRSWLAVALLLTALGSAWPAQSAHAQLCLNTTEAAPLDVCAFAAGNHQTWVRQPNGSVYQYFQNAEPSNGWQLSLRDDTQQLDFGFYIPTANFVGVQRISNALTGTGTHADPWILRTELLMPAPDIELTQELIYINGERTLRKRWTVRNNSAVTYEDLRFFHGGDAYFGGTDSARGWYEPDTQMVYLTNPDFHLYGYMGMAPHPATPSSHYHAGSFSLGRNSARTRQLTDSINTNYSDAGYYLQWNQARLGAGEQWVIEAREIWTPPGIIQSFAPAPTYITAGSTRTVTFKVQNVAETPVTFSASASLGGSGSALLGTTQFTLDPLEIAEVPVEVTLPADSSGTQTLSFQASSGADTSLAQVSISVLDLQYAISPEPVDFGPANIGSSTSRTLTFSNLSTTQALTLGQLDPARTLGAAYSLGDDQCSGQTLAGGSNCSVTLVHTPTSAVAYAGTLHWPLTAPVLTTLESEVIAARGSIPISATAGTGGHISPASLTVAHEEQATFTIHPDEHFRIATVTGCGGTLNGNEYTTAPLTGACTVHAQFSLMQYPVQTSATGWGTFSPSSQLVDAGSSTTFRVLPNPNYRIDTVSGCGGTLHGSQYTTGVITSACTVSASFSLNRYEVTTTSQGNGSISPATATVEHASTGVFTLTPDVGHRVATITGCNGRLSGNTYTTDAVTRNCRIDVSFSVNHYRVLTYINGEGSVSPESPQVPHGQSATFLLTPAPGYSIDSVAGCAGALQGNQYITEPVTGPCAVIADFSLNHYDVTASSQGNGSISPGTVNVAHGDAATFTVTPATGYSIDTVSGCNGVLEGSEYTTDTITGACTVTASFTLNHYEVTASSTGNGSISPETDNIAHGRRATLTVTADDGYRISSVSGCDGTLDGGSYTTGEITEACAVTASFERSTPLFTTDLSIPLDLDADTLLTALPQAMYPQATAADGTVLQAELISGPSRFLPGRHELQWRVTDEQGRATTATQVLRVWPRVSLGKDTHVGLRRGDHGSFRIALSGPAPEYPFEIDYEVGAVHPEIDLRASTVRFEAGELEKEVYFAVTAEPAANVEERSVNVWLSGVRNATPGDRLAITFSRVNLPPTVSVLALRDGATAGAFDRHGGAITLQALITDPNASDSHDVTWETPAGASVIAAGDRLTLDGSSLPAGVHRFQALVQDDGAPVLSTAASFDLVLLDRTPALPAGATGWLENGLPDHPDHALPMRNVLPERGGELHHYLLETQAGLHLALGSHARLADAAQAQIQPEALDLPADSISNVGGYFDFQIGQLPSAGQGAAIVLPQRAAIPEQAVYRKYDARQRRWYSFVENTKNQLASATGAPGHCPPPDSELYSEGLTAGDWCVRLTLEDGGPNDGDGTANGVILDPGGVGRQEAVAPVAPPPPPTTPPANAPRPRGGRGSSDAWLLLLFVAAMLARTAIRSMARHR